MKILLGYMLRFVFTIGVLQMDSGQVLQGYQPSKTVPFFAQETIPFGPCLVPNK